MDDLQRYHLDARLNDLHREGARLRAERLAAERATTDAGSAVAGGRAGDHPPARVRLGRWLMGVGSAVAGTNHNHDAHGADAGHAGHAA